MPSRPRLRACLCAAAALAALLALAPSAGAADARFEAASADGGFAFFSTTDQLASGDTDNRTDVYVRHFDASVGEAGAFVTRLVSLGPSGGNNAIDATFGGVAADGQLVLFSTRERLTAADGDARVDVYARDLEAKTTTLVSGAGDGPFDANYVGMSEDGARAFFSTREQLTAGDGDEAFDVYAGDTTTAAVARISQGGAVCAPACGNGAFDASFLGASADGAAIAFESSEPLAGQPGAAQRIYLRDLSEPASPATRLVSPSGECPAGKSAEECKPIYRGISADGSHVFFETSSRLTGDDTDEAQDVYAWDGAVTRASTGPSGGNEEANSNALFAGSTPDGSSVYVETGEQLVAADIDSSQDVYQRDLEGEATTLVSQGTVGGNGAFNAGVVRQDIDSNGVAVSGAETRVFFFSKEQLTGDDEDESFDVFVRTLPAGETERVSRGTVACEPACGNGAVDANYSAAASDGSRVFFVTGEALDGEDLDGGAKDVYARDLGSGATTRITRGDNSICGTPPCDNGAKDAQLHGASADGSIAFFVSEERLTADADAADDKVYARVGSITRLVSAGNPAGLQLGPATPLLIGTAPGSPAASTAPRVLGNADPGSFVKLYETSDCSGEPLATGDAATLADPGITATVEAGATTSFRATAEADGFVSSCSEPVAYTQQNGGSGGGGGGGGGSGGGSGGSDSGGGLEAPSTGSLVPIGPEVRLALQPPQTRITFGPAFKTRARRPVFRFTDATGQPGTRFICKLDRRRWRGCSSPVKLRRLGRGRHVFRVKGVNARGQWEAKPTRRAFKLVRGKPQRRNARHTRRGRR